MVLEVTVNIVLLAAGVTGLSEGVTASVGITPAWVTVTTIGDTPATVTVMLATRDE